MRQVKYRRPPTHIEPLNATPTTDIDSKQSPNRLAKSKDSAAESKDGNESKQSFGSNRHKSSAAHVDRIRTYKSKGQVGPKVSKHRKSNAQRSTSTNNTDDERNAGDDDNQEYENDDEFLTNDDEDNHNITIQVFEGDSEYEHDSFFNEGEGSLISTESRLPIAGMERSVKVTRESDGGRDGDEHQPTADFNSRIAGEGSEGKLSEDLVVDNINQNISFVDAKIECSIINREYLVLSVVGMDGPKLLQAEAEINRVDLNMFGEFPMEEALDPSALNDLAQQMVENVELRIDPDGQCRILLNLLNESEDGDSKYGSINNDWDYQNFSSQPLACASEEELQQMLLPGN